MCTNQNSSAQCLTRPLRRNPCRLGPPVNHVRESKTRTALKPWMYFSGLLWDLPSFEKKKKKKKGPANRRKQTEEQTSDEPSQSSERPPHLSVGPGIGGAQLQRGKLIAVTWRKNNICSSCSVTRETKAISVHLRLDHNHRLAARPPNKKPHLIGKKSRFNLLVIKACGFGYLFSIIMVHLVRTDLMYLTAAGQCPSIYTALQLVNSSEIHRDVSSNMKQTLKRKSSKCVKN